MMFTAYQLAGKLEQLVEVQQAERLRLIAFSFGSTFEKARSKDGLNQVQFLNGEIEQNEKMARVLRHMKTSWDLD